VSDAGSIFAPAHENLPPIITLTTDFGGTDSYVAEMKGVLLTGCPAARIVDVTHAITPQDILSGSIVLERVLRFFPSRTIHIAVVDPGVGTNRRLIAAEIAGQILLCPDNGLITWAWKLAPAKARARELIWRPRAESGHAFSATFHGRDILAPAAAQLVGGRATLEMLTAPAPIEPVLLPIEPAPLHATAGVIIHIDHFGNAITNLSPDPQQLHSARVGRRMIPIRRTYADVPEGNPVALVGSSGLLEIAVRNGHAAKTLALHVGTRVRLS